MEDVIPLCLSLTLFKLTLSSPIHKLVINRIKEKNDCVHVTFLLAWNFFFLHIQDDISSEEPSTMEKHKAMYGPVLLSLCQVCIVDYNLCKTAVTQKSLAASSACVSFFSHFWKCWSWGHQQGYPYTPWEDKSIKFSSQAERWWQLKKCQTEDTVYLI